MVAIRPSFFTEREYLALEAVAETRHELVSGQILGMAGAELGHNQVCQNLRLELGNIFNDRPCRVLGGDQRVKVEATREYFYPDVLVTCLERVLVDPRPRSLVNPQVVIEVLSSSTETYDRGEKWLAYQRIPTLTDYVLVSAEELLVEHFQRAADDSWTLRRLRGGQLRLASGVAIDVLSCYRLVADVRKPGVDIDLGPF